MRLDEKQKEALRHATCDIDGAVYLFGSRANNDKKGGDVDVLIVTADDPFEVSRKVTVDFQMECDEKIDVLAVSPHEGTHQEELFLKNIDKLVKIK